ncbi:S-adenosyl-l-methionine hydroxide adenosyltransferase family protein [Halobacillus salinarum]|uniref:S-adenosyl-l-methionine hydroxide adenosyltransferase family protein n=1 Tax=Halobacillus salinarum TaxID=2932257 RepID=A0ABY4EKE6_9BACI|nr:S-adenosyl-l-methionine hydroxide adenosyltransferase family protein [Halobacillus salinarum]UOQ44517.1 S-adenosyl-l-methionine hydroxide adenosyltransferase family protein [Halobacillus salinarum]
MAKALVMQSDFGISDGAVSAMHGVAHSVEAGLSIFDLTHDIPPFKIWDASYRLWQTMKYWKEGTVFVSVIDPGVGSTRRSLGVKTASGHYIITPDNGSLTHISRTTGIVEAREIDESTNRLPKSGESYTFHGRDIYAYTGARLAAGAISFEQVGPKVDVSSLVELNVKESRIDGSQAEGIIDILDIRFGNLWTNIQREMFKELDISFGDALEVTIRHDGRTVYQNDMTFGRSFADTHMGEPLVYINSLDNLAVAINQGSFANAYGIGTGSNWEITFRKVKD